MRGGVRLRLGDDSGGGPGLNTIRPQSMYVGGILYHELREWRDLLVVDALLVFYCVYEATRWY